MKIAFLNIYQQEVSRGAEVFVTELSQRLNKNHQIQIISGVKSSQSRWKFLWRFYLDPDGLAVFWFTCKHIITLLKGNFDIVIPLNGGWQPAIIRLVTWLTGKRMIIVGQSGMGWDDRNNLFCTPDVFIALTTEAKKWALSTAPWVSSIYIPNGVDTSTFTPKGKRYVHKLPSPVVLTVAALTSSKRIEKTIEAVAKTPDVSLLVVGKGDLHQKLMRLGNEKLGKRFKLISAPYKEMPAIYRSVDSFALCSVSSEAFGNVYVEALSSNLPVVATDDEKRHEIVRDAGLFVNPDDIDAYAKAIVACVSRRWGNKPRNQSKLFDWDIIAQSYERLFQSFK